MATNSRTLPTWWVAGAGVLAAATVAVGGYLLTRPPAARPGSGAREHLEAPSGGGIFRPPTVSADDAQLADDERVVGVKVNGRARAYRQSALMPVLDHVVNDVIDWVPVSVTYCDLCDCTRVFTGEGSDALELAPGAYRDGLLLRVRGRLYRQDNGAPVVHGGAEFPYWMYPFELTSWKHWRTENPDTDVYLGRPGVAETMTSGGG